MGVDQGGSHCCSRFQPQSAGGLICQPARTLAHLHLASFELFIHGKKKWMQHSQKFLRRIAVFLVPQKFVSCMTHTACHFSGQQIDKIIADLHEIVRGLIYFRRFPGNLHKFGQHPLRIHLTAAAHQEFLPALFGQRRDTVRLRLRAVMLPQLQLRMRIRCKLLCLAKRPAILHKRQKSGRSGVNTDADHIIRPAARFLHHLTDRVIHGLNIIVNLLQGVIRRQLFQPAARAGSAAFAGRSGRNRQRSQNPVRIRIDTLGNYLAAVHADQHRSRRKSAVIQSDHVFSLLRFADRLHNTLHFCI